MSIIRNNQYYNVQSKTDSNIPTHIYLDLDIVNNNTESLTKPPDLTFTETRNSPYLTSPDQYYCSIVRFNIMTGNSIPVFIPRIVTGQDDPNKTVYQVGMSYGSYHVYLNVTYECEDATQPLASKPLLIQDFSSDYYNVYNYQSFTKQINKCIYDVWLLLVNQASISSSTPPIIEFDPNIGKFMLLAEQAYYDQALNAHITVYFNTRLMQLFQSLPNKFLGYTPLYNPSENYSLTVINNSYTNMRLIQNLSLGRSVNYITMYAEINSLSMWNPVQSLVFISSVIPVAPTLSSPAKVISDTKDNTLTSNIGTSNLSSVLTDFSLEVTNLNAYRPSLSYVPQSEYRLLDLFSTSNLSSISISVFWKDVFGMLHPLKIEAGASANLKVMFRKKTFNNI